VAPRGSPVSERRNDRLSWLDAVLAAGATAASFVPDTSPDSADVGDPAGVEFVEDATLETHAIDESAWRPRATSFLDGFQSWRVVAYDRIVPVLRAWVAAGVRRRDAGRRLRTVHEIGHELAITFTDRLSPAVRSALEASGVPIVSIADEGWGPPGAALAAARRALETARVGVEREAGKMWPKTATEDEWLVVDGVLSDHAALAAHARAIGVVKNPGARYFDGSDLETALTLPAEHRTSVFQPPARGAAAVHSWYLRLWPWEGNDLLHGLVRVEAPARRETAERADAISAWLLAERAPLTLPDARWHRLLYPLHDVETYLRTRAPAFLRAEPAGRLPARPA